MIKKTTNQLNYTTQNHLVESKTCTGQMSATECVPNDFLPNAYSGWTTFAHSLKSLAHDLVFTHSEELTGQVSALIKGNEF